MVSVNINAEAARKAVPGLQEAYAIHQLSERNNTSTLSNKFTSDLAHTTSAMKDATISGASLAVRGSKAVGQTLVSRKKMAKASMKGIVYTGALGVKTGRAVKGLMSDMVDAADKKGKYQPKVRPFVPHDGQSKSQPQIQPAQQVHAYEYQQHMQQQLQSQQSLPPQVVNNTLPGVSPTSTVPAAALKPARVPVRKPVRPQPHSLVSSPAAINNQQPSFTATSTVPVAMSQLDSSMYGQALQMVNHHENPSAAEISPQPYPQQSNTTHLGQVNTSNNPVPATAFQMQPTPAPTTATQSATHPGTSGSVNMPQAQQFLPTIAVPMQLQTLVQPLTQAQGTDISQNTSPPPSYIQATTPPAAIPGMTQAQAGPLPQTINLPPQRPVAVQQHNLVPAPLRPQSQALQQPIGGQPVSYVPQQTIYQSQQPYIDPAIYTTTQSSAAPAPTQPIVVENNSTVVQQSTDGQDFMLAQMQMQLQMAMAQQQQSATNELLLQQQANTQNMMLAQAQAQQTAVQQTVYVDQNVYIDQSSQSVTAVDEQSVMFASMQDTTVVNVQDNSVTGIQDSTDVTFEESTEIVTFDETDYVDSSAVVGTEDEEVYFEEDTATADFCEEEYVVDDTEDAYAAEVDVSETALSF
jgi:hypothetical protein